MWFPTGGPSQPVSTVQTRSIFFFLAGLAGSPGQVFHNSLLPSPSFGERRGIVSLGIRLSRCHAVCVRRISLGGEGNVLYPVL